jgi:hypothetical protein
MKKSFLKSRTRTNSGYGFTVENNTMNNKNVNNYNKNNNGTGSPVIQIKRKADSFSRKENIKLNLN